MGPEKAETRQNYLWEPLQKRTCIGDSEGIDPLRDLSGRKED